MGICIKGGRVIDPANGVDRVCDVYIKKNRISSVSEDPGFPIKETIDASGKLVCPGIVDLRARLREPGMEHKATIESEMPAAYAGGITTIAIPPDTNPVIDTPAMAHLIQQLGIRKKPGINLIPIGALTRELNSEILSDLVALKQAGCSGFSNARHPIRNSRIMLRIMEYAASFELTVHLHAVDPWLEQDGVMHEGPVSTRLGLTGTPDTAEIAGVARDLALVAQSGCKAHFMHISSGKALNLIRRARYDGLNVTADVSAHHLHLTEHDVGMFDTRGHIIPPFRSQSDLEALRSGLADGSISAICSDHAPHERDAKLAAFAQSAPGLSGLETLLPLTLKLVHSGIIPLVDAIAMLTEKPAEILGVKAGTLSPGSAANLCLIDPDVEWQFDTRKMLSRGKNSPCNRWPFQGCVTQTLVKGKTVFNLDE